MGNCGQACPYNTLDGCKVKEYNAICPLSNMATPITEYKMTNADRIRAMSDEELASNFAWLFINNITSAIKFAGGQFKAADGLHEETTKEILEWLKQPVEVDNG